MKQRLKIYNKVNGDAPPSTHKMRDWDPPLIPPIYANNLSENALSNQLTKNNRPFQNSRTKSYTKSINILDATLDGTPEIPDENNPTMSAFIQDQLVYEDTLVHDDTQINEVDNTICSFHLSVPTICSAHQHRSDQTPITSDTNDIVQEQPNVHNVDEPTINQHADNHRHQNNQNQLDVNDGIVLNGNHNDARHGNMSTHHLNRFHPL